MSLAILVRDARGQREFREADLPLALGAPGESDIELPGSDAPQGRLVVQDGRPFIQPAGTGSLTLNGRPLRGAAQIADGDELVTGRSQIRFTLQSSRLTVLLGSVSGAATLPPGAPDGTAGHETAVDAPDEPLDTGDTAAERDNPPPVPPADLIETQPFRRPELKRAGGRRPVRLMPALFAAGFVVLIAVAWFMFTARAVQVHVQPAPDEMRIEGGWFAPELGGRFLLQPGSYTVIAKKAGFRDTQETIAVGRAAHQEFAFSMEKLPGLLQVVSEPVSGAEVLIDGVSRGTTPLAGAELRPGRHRVLIRADRYREFESEIDIEGGGTEQQFVARLEPNWVSATIASRPTGAELSVDGEVTGTTPVTLDLLAGSHELSLRAQGHKTWQSRVTVTAGEALELPEIVLEKSDGKVSVRSDPAGASVTVDGAYRGQTPLRLALPPNRSYTLSLTRAGYETATREISVRTGEDASLSVSLDPVLGNVRIVTRPADAEILIDGVSQGVAGRTLALTAVPHQVEARKDGYATASASVTPRPGFDQEISLVLQTSAEAKAAARPKSIRTAAGQELRLVLPGSFRAGASRREQGRRANEVMFPVELTRPFYIGTHEVTNAQYRAWRSEHNSGRKNQYDLNGDRQPVVRVTWEDAARYCNWLSRRESLTPFYGEKGGRLTVDDPSGTGYRLPTEAEWAWSARFAGGASSGLKFPWGDALPPAPKSGNFADHSARQIASIRMDDYEDGHAVSAPVGSYEANPLGLFDLGGNVAEWVHDFYAIPIGDNEQTQRDPMGPAEGEFHVIRGSGYLHGGIGELRLTYRDYGSTTREDLGFRIARYAD